MNLSKGILIAAADLSFGILPNRQIVIEMRYPKEVTGLAPHVELGVALTPTEARHLARVLQKKADEAEVGLPRA